MHNEDDDDDNKFKFSFGINYTIANGNVSMEDNKIEMQTIRNLEADQLETNCSAIAKTKIKITHLVSFPYPLSPSTFLGKQIERTGKKSIK